MARCTLILTLLFASCTPRDDVIVVQLTPEPGPGRISNGLLSLGPSSDPIGGQWDLSDEVVTGVPDSLADLNVRFVDFQWQHIVLQAYTDGRIDSAAYHPYRDPTLNITLPDEPFDQHVHYAIGREPDGDFVIVFDTDNDEDLSDEKGVVFPWSDPLPEAREYFAEVHASGDWVRRLNSFPRLNVSAQVSDGRKVYDTAVHLVVVPHLVGMRPTESSTDATGVATYMIGSFQNMVGAATLDETIYTFWVGSHQPAVYHPTYTKIWFERGDQRGAETESASSFAHSPFLIGQVIDVGGKYYRLDDVRIDGSELRLVRVESMPGVGIRPGMDAPEFRSVTIEGDGLKLSDYRGKYVLLDFWATSCGPCLAALPELRRLHAEISRDDFEIIGIAEDDPEWLRRFVADNGIAWSQVTQNRSEETRRDILDKYMVTGIPAYFLIDPQGRVAKAGWDAGPSALADSLHVWISGQSG